MRWKSIGVSIDNGLWYDISMFYRSRTLLVFLSAALILNGCILERIFRVKDQLCDFDKYFQIEISEGFRIILLEPVMLDKDITRLAGAEPSEKKIIDDELVMTYIAERKGEQTHGQYDLPIELRFVRIDEEYRLKEGYIGKNLTEMLTDELLTQIMQSICQSEKSLIQQKVVIDIRALDRTLLPTKSEIIGILGPPNPNAGIPRIQRYDYQLKNHFDADKMIAIKIEFDSSGYKILRIKVKYLGYSLQADLSQGESVLSVDIFDFGETRNEVQRYRNSKVQG